MPNEKRNEGDNPLLRGVLWSCLGYLLCGALLLLEAVLLEKGILPEETMEVICWIVVGLAALCASVFSAGKSKRRVLGSFSGTLVFFFLALISGFLLGGTLAPGRAAIMGGILLVDTLLGAIISGLIWG